MPRITRILRISRRWRGQFVARPVRCRQREGEPAAAAGCAGDWDPACEATAMVKGDDGLWKSGPFKVTAGDYEVKVAMDGSWTLNYGVDGKEGGDNYKLSLTADGEVTFIFDPATNLLTWEIK